MLKKMNKGFTFNEVLVAVLVVGVLLAVGIPSFVTAFITSSETDAITSLGKLSAALEVYRTLYKTYPSNLSSLTIVNPTLSAGTLLSAGSKGVYNYQFEQASTGRNTFAVTASPKTGSFDGLHTFKVDQSGSFYRADTLPTIVFSPYNPNNPPININTPTNPAATEGASANN